MNTNHKYSLHQKFCLDYCWDQKNVNLNYEEHCGYVNFLVESNWSLKKNRKTVHHVCFQRNQPFTFKGGGRGKERGGEKASCPQHSSDAEVFQETICIFLFHTALPSYNNVVCPFISLALKHHSTRNKQAAFIFFDGWRSPNMSIQKLRDIFSSTLTQKV